MVKVALIGAGSATFAQEVITDIWQFNEDREAAVHALMPDPLICAVCSLAEIRQMFDEMASMQRAYLPHFINPD